MKTYKFSMGKNGILTCYMSDNTLNKFTGTKALEKLNYIKNFSFYDVNTYRKKIDTDKYSFSLAFVSNNHIVTFEDISKFQRKASFSIETILKELIAIIKENERKNLELEENIKRQYNIDVRKTKAIALSAFSAALMLMNSNFFNRNYVKQTVVKSPSIEEELSSENIVEVQTNTLVKDNIVDTSLYKAMYTNNNEYDVYENDNTSIIKEFEDYDLVIDNNTAKFITNETWDGTVLNETLGVVENGPFGTYETYYDADVISDAGMDNVVKYMRDLGYDEENYPYYIREDGVRMFGNYVMVAADLDTLPKGTIIETTLGTAIVCDACESASKNNRQVDIAVNWTKKLALKNQ